MSQMVEGSSFDITERFDEDGALRLALHGELDITVADALTERLDELKQRMAFVRLDLAELGFMDSSGLRAVILALADSRQDGWRLEIADEVSAPVARLIDIAGVRSRFWPPR
jgi:anti-sigma B factor antagonist